MDPGHSLWRTQAFTVAPTRNTGEITDSDGAALGTWDAQGTVRDSSGTALLQAPVRSKGHRHKPAEVEMDLSDAGGAALGTARVVKYGLGPRGKKATVAIVDAQGAEVARLEPRDDKGEQLAVTSGTEEYATIGVTEVKAGFLRKARVYSVSVASEVPEAIRPLVVAAAVRYDALLDGLVAAVMAADAKKR